MGRIAPNVLNVKMFASISCVCRKCLSQTLKHFLDCSWKTAETLISIVQMKFCKTVCLNAGTSPPFTRSFFLLAHVAADSLLHFNLNVFSLILCSAILPCLFTSNMSGLMYVTHLTKAWSKLFHELCLLWVRARISELPHYLSRKRLGNSSLLYLKTTASTETFSFFFPGYQTMSSLPQQH